MTDTLRVSAGPDDDLPTGYVSVSIAADRIGCSGSAVRKALREDRLRGYQTQGRWFVQEDDIDRFTRTSKVARNVTQPNAQPAATGSELVATGTSRNDLDLIAEALREVAASVADATERAATAEERAQKAEQRLREIESGSDELRRRAEDAEARAAELADQVETLRARRWWHLFRRDAGGGA